MNHIQTLDVVRLPSDSGGLLGVVTETHEDYDSEPPILTALVQFIGGKKRHRIDWVDLEVVDSMARILQPITTTWRGDPNNDWLHLQVRAERKYVAAKKELTP